MKNCIPIMLQYIINFESFRAELREKPTTAEANGIRITLPSATEMLGVDPAQWLKDACIDSLGQIGSADPRIVLDAMGVLTNISNNDTSQYSRKKALRALDLINKAKTT